MLLGVAVLVVFTTITLMLCFTMVIDDKKEENK